MGHFIKAEEPLVNRVCLTKIGVWRWGLEACIYFGSVLLFCFVMCEWLALYTPEDIAAPHCCTFPTVMDGLSETMNQNQCLLLNSDRSEKSSQHTTIKE